MGNPIDLKTASFDHKEAVALINCAVYPTLGGSPRISEIGVIVGLLDMNDEVEIIVKFQSSVSQYTKSELLKKFTIDC